MWVIGDLLALSLYLPWAQCNGEPRAFLRSLSVDMPHAIFMTGQGGGEGGALKETERGARERPTDRWFPLWSDAQTSNELSLDPSLPSTNMSKMASKFFTMATNRGLSRPFPSTGRTENGFGTDLILMSQAKRVSSKPHHSGMDGWLHPSVLPSHSQTYPRLIADVMN